MYSCRCDLTKYLMCPKANMLSLLLPERSVKQPCASVCSARLCGAGGKKFLHFIGTQSLPVNQSINRELKKFMRSGVCLCSRVPVCMLTWELCSNLCWSRAKFLFTSLIVSAAFIGLVYLLLPLFFSFAVSVLFKYWVLGNRQMKITAKPDPCCVFILCWVTLEDNGATL